MSSKKIVDDIVSICKERVRTGEKPKPFAVVLSHDDSIHAEPYEAPAVTCHMLTFYEGLLIMIANKEFEIEQLGANNRKKLKICNEIEYINKQACDLKTRIYTQLSECLANKGAVPFKTYDFLVGGKFAGLPFGDHSYIDDEENTKKIQH